MASATDPWDLLVVGGGTAGLVGAHTAARLGARVALVERERTGGDCLWTGCVPSKALLAAAGRAADARRAAALGVSVSGVTTDLEAVLAHVRSAIAAIEPADSPDALREAGVHVLSGSARFTAPSSLEVRGPDSDVATLRFHQALVATGAAPGIPPVPGLAEVQPLTSETIWGLETLPYRLTVIGGGSTGCELGQAFARLGASVTIVEAGPRLLPGEDPDASAVLRAALEHDGVEVLTGYRAISASGMKAGPGTVTVKGEGAERALEHDVLLVATGRRPRSGGLGLSHAGVATNAAGFITVDATLRTSNPRIWAAGDVTAHQQLTHLAGVNGAVAASNAVLGLRRRAEVWGTPRVTFTDPEIAAVGSPTWVRGTATEPRTVTRRHTEVDRAIAEGRTDGFTRLALGRRGRVLGGTIVGPRAGESLAEITLAVRRGLTATDLAAIPHPYPTYGDGVWAPAVAVVEKRLAAPATRRVTAALVAARRSWAARTSPGKRIGRAHR